jgi:hypothetical protein
VKDLKCGNVQDAVRKVDFTRHDEKITDNIEDILFLMAPVSVSARVTALNCQTLDNAQRSLLWF